MDLEEILHKLEEAKEIEDWDMVDESIESIRVLIDNFDEYQSEESTCNTLLLEQNSAWSNYPNSVSDHRPVIISLKIN